MHLGRARLEEHRHDLPGGRAADDRVVDDDDALPAHLGQRVELHADPVLAQSLVGLDERPPDVAVLDQALLEGDPARAREADRGRRAGVRNRHHEVGLRRRLGGEPLAHAHAGAVELDAAQVESGPREVDELEDAERAAVARLDRLLGVHALRVDDDELAGLQLPHRLGAEEVERAALRGEEDRRRARPSTSGRMPSGSRKPTSLPSERSTPRTRPRCAPSPPRPPPRAAARRARRGRRSPRCRRSTRAARRARELGPQLLRVREVAVVGERDRARGPCWTIGCAFVQCVEPVVE